MDNNLIYTLAINNICFAEFVDNYIKENREANKCTEEQLDKFDSLAKVNLFIDPYVTKAKSQLDYLSNQNSEFEELFKLKIQPLIKDIGSLERELAELLEVIPLHPINVKFLPISFSANEKSIKPCSSSRFLDWDLSRDELWLKAREAISEADTELKLLNDDGCTKKHRIKKGFYNDFYKKSSDISKIYIEFSTCFGKYQGLKSKNHDFYKQLSHWEIELISKLKPHFNKDPYRMNGSSANDVIMQSLSLIKKQLIQR